jgi:hypothetical protein
MGFIPERRSGLHAFVLSLAQRGEKVDDADSALEWAMQAFSSIYEGRVPTLNGNRLLTWLSAPALTPFEPFHTIGEAKRAPQLKRLRKER